MSRTIRKTPQRTRGTLAAAYCGFALCIAASVFFGIRVWHGFWFLAFSDEAEHILGGRMLNAGGRLYVTYVDTHGPVIFMFTQAYGALFGWLHPSYTRFIMPILSIFSALSIILSPILCSAAERFISISIFFSLISIVWIVQGIYLLNFYQISGFFCVIGISLFIVCAWKGCKIHKYFAIISGCSFSIVIFTAYSFAPSVIILTISGFMSLINENKKSSIFYFITGAMSGSIFIVIWLLIYGNLINYFVFHVIFNQISYAKFINFSFSSFFHSLEFSFSQSREIQTFSVLFCFLSCLLFVLTELGARERPRQILPILVGYAGILLLNARGSLIFQDATFLVTSIGTLSLAVAGAARRFYPMERPVFAVFGTLVIATCIAGTEFAGRQALSTPAPLTRSEIVSEPESAAYRPMNSPLYAKVRSIVRPNEKVLALPYAPEFYWYADRLPMDGYYEYLPWDAAYAKHPWFGRARDICDSLKKSPPRLIYFDNWKVWGMYAPEDYMPCVLNILATKYVRLDAYPTLYVRRDVEIAR